MGVGGTPVGVTVNADSHGGHNMKDAASISGKAPSSPRSTIEIMPEVAARRPDRLRVGT